MDCKKLKSLFISDISKAIDESQKMICSISKFDFFQDFTSYHLNNAHFNYCPKPFSANFVPQMSIYCIDCAAKNDNLSIMCLDCFLNGNHKGHKYFIFPGFMGNCECGDKIHLKNTGFCSKHQGCNDDENIDNYLDENLRSTLTNVIFLSAFKALQRLQQTDTEKSTKIGEFIISFFNLGDGFRRLFVRTIIQNDLLNELLYNVQDSPSTIILTIFSYLMHDQLFMRNFSKSVISLISGKTIEDSSEIMTRQPDTISPNYNIWYQFVFTCFSSHFCRYNIENNNWDWVTFSIKLLNQYKRLLIMFKSYRYMTYPLVFTIIKFIHFATSVQPNEKTQEFFDKIFTEVFNIGVNEAHDTIIVDTYKKFAISSQIVSYLDFLSMFEYLMISFKEKQDLKFDKLIDELEKSIDIAPLFMISKNSVGDESGKNNENDKLISRFIIKKEQSNESKSFFAKFKSKMKNIFDSFPSKYYKSFYNGASFYVCHPLYDSFSMLFRVDDLCRIKLARFLCLEKYQPLRVKLGIISLKKLLSIICFRIGLFRIRNFSLLFLFDKVCETKKDVLYNMIPVSVLQLLIGLQCTEKTENNNIDDEFILKEFFSFELAREIGIFEEKVPQKDMLVFTFLYVSLMIVIDRNLFNYEYKKILEEQVIFALKKGVHSIDKLNEICNINLDNPKEYFSSFNEILMKVARKSTKDDDIKEENNNNNDANNENNNTNISLQDLANMKPSDDDDDDEDDKDDDDNDDENVKNKPNLNALRARRNGQMNDKKETKKENQNSYIKPVNFYLKDEIECNAISSVNPIDEQRSYLNIEISKSADKLLKIQEFEPEETYFFHHSRDNENDNNNDNSEISTDGLKIHLKQFLQTPTILAVVYDTLRKNSEADQQKAELNEHLAMNILILISRFIKEESIENKTASSTFDSKTKIQYISLPDLISKLKRVVFNYRVLEQETDDKPFIENTLDPSNFVSLLKMKFEPRNLPPKSLIDILQSKGKLGQYVLHQISNNVHIDELEFLDNKEKEINTEEETQRAAQKKKAKKLKEDIMNQFSNIRNQYHFSDSISDSFSMSNSGFFSPNKETCSLCSEVKKNDILCYPLYIYRTKFPFIVDKPPLVKSSEIDGISVYDNEEDFDKDTDIVEFLREELKIKGEHSEEEMYKLSKFKKIITSIFEQQSQEKEAMGIGHEETKRVTAGANFVVQYGICPHPVHRSCVNEDEFTCPIDRSAKNGFLPSLEDIPSHIIFKDMHTFELNKAFDNEETLLSNIIESIECFINKFTSFFECLKDERLNVFVELIKSMSGLIDTYEIRVRNLPDSLDSTKTKILARNLFLTVWYAYRIHKKPKLTIFSKAESKEVDTDSRLTEFQKFIKFLIEFDDFEKADSIAEVKKKIASISNSIIASANKNRNLKEKEACLFLRRACLAEHFLLDFDVRLDEQDLLDWDDVLSTDNLGQRYGVEFTTSGEFEFKPFVLTNFPREFLSLAQPPYSLPIAEVQKITIFNVLDYNYLIKNYDDFDDVREADKNNMITNAATQEINGEKTDTSNKDRANNQNQNQNKNRKNDDNNENTQNNENNNNNSTDDENEKRIASDNSCSGENNNGSICGSEDEARRYQRAVHICDDEFLPFFMAFYGKLHYPSVLMFTGALASQIFLVDQFQGAALETPYVDCSGCPDINHVRMQPLFLSDERYEKLIDQILSGDFSYNLSSLKKKKDMFNQDVESSDLF